MLPADIHRRLESPSEPKADVMVFVPITQGSCCDRCVAVDDDRLCEQLPCMPNFRADGQWGYFVKSTTT